MREELKQLISLDTERQRLSNIASVLGWDQETYMPEKAVTERADQLATIEGLAHAKAVDPRIGDLLGILEGATDLDEYAAAYIRVARREYDKETKLPSALVEEIARQTSLSQAAWAKARKDDDFSAFAPSLEKMLDLSRQTAACLDPSKKPYDVLLDLFEIGSDEASTGAIFATMKKALTEVMDKIRSRPQVDDSFLQEPVSAAAQGRMSEYFMDALGYDRSRGRLDTTAHPFTTTLGRDDVRITTRFEEEYFPSSIFSTIHETGHAFYELGMNPHPDYRFTRLADASSTGIHESQSRTWENIIGRSLPFWKRHYTAVASAAEGRLDGVSVESFVKAVNKVEASLIRTESDEVTYGLHIIARFELESALVSGNLAVKDVPDAWNSAYKTLLGLDVPNNALGCLQDIHWSMGAFGYFPSYALGNLYASQFWSAMTKDIPDMDARLEAGDCAIVLAWLEKNIHRCGAMYLPGELVEKVTGKALDPAYFARYLNEKYGRIYGF